MKQSCPGVDVPTFVTSLIPLVGKDHSLQCLSGGILSASHKKNVFIHNLFHGEKYNVEFFTVVLLTTLNITTNAAAQRSGCR